MTLVVNVSKILWIRCLLELINNLLIWILLFIFVFSFNILEGYYLSTTLRRCKAFIGGYFWRKLRGPYYWLNHFFIFDLILSLIVFLRHTFISILLLFFNHSWLIKFFFIIFLFFKIYLLRHRRNYFFILYLFKIINKFSILVEIIL